MEAQEWSADEIETTFGPVANLGEVIERLETHFEEIGAVVCEIKINGMVLKEGDENQFSSSSLEGVEKVEVRYSSPKQVTGEALIEVHDLIPKLTEACEVASDLYRGGEMHGAQEIVGGLIQNCQHVIELFSLVIHAYTKPDWSEVISQWRGSMDVFSSLIQEMLVAMENKDYVLMADLLEFEMPQALEAWLNLAKLLRNRVGSGVSNLETP